MAKLKSFEQFVAEMDRAEEIQDDGVEQGTPEVKGAERAEDEAEEVQAEESPESEVALEETEEEVEETEEVAEEEVEETEEVEEGNAFGAARAEAIAKGEKEFTVDGETYPVEDVDAEDKENAEEFANESEEVEETEEASEEAEEVMESCSEMLEKCYESCKNEAKAYEEDAHDEHTIESYMKENAALVATLAAKSLKEMKEDYAIEAYEAACNEMIEAYTKKMNEMKEAEAAYGSEEESAE